MQRWEQEGGGRGSHPQKEKIRMGGEQEYPFDRMRSGREAYSSLFFVFNKEKIGTKTERKTFAGNLEP